jgi:hypothetical protein
VGALKARYGVRDCVIAGTSSAAAAPGGAAGGRALAASLLEVTLELAPAAGGGGSGARVAKTAKKRLPQSTTVGALKLLAERLFRVKASRQALALVVGGGEQDIGEDDTKPLSFWDPQVGPCEGGSGLWGRRRRPGRWRRRWRRPSSSGAREWEVRRSTSARPPSHPPSSRPGPRSQPGAVVRVSEAEGGAGAAAAAAARVAAAAAEQEARMAEQLRAGERLRVAAAVS